MTESKTVIQAFDRAVEKHGDRAALQHKEHGAWQTRSWQAYRDEVRRVGRALIELGVQPGAGAPIIGFNSPAWIIAHLGAIHSGARPAGIYTTNTAEQCRYITEHCDAEIAFVDDAEQLEKFLAFRDELPRLRAIVLMHGQSDATGVYTWSDFLAKGTPSHEAALEARIAAQRPDDVCSYIYTSGTTGEPKAVMLSHDNVVWTAESAIGMVDFGPAPVLLSYLPLSHIAEQAFSLYGAFVHGATVACAESMEALPDNLREIRPTALLGVPRVWEKIEAKIAAAGAKNPPLKRLIARRMRRVGLATAYANERNGPVPFLYPLAKKLVFDKVRKQLGLDRCTLQVTAAAPIAKSTLEFFASLGLPLMEVFGMSEATGPVTVSTPHRHRLGKVGRPIPGSELRIAPDGEICIRSRAVFKGYFKDPEATTATVDADGWLMSGDIGSIDSDGFLEITDRKKDIIITAGGENIAPAAIEVRLKQISVVAHAVVIGDKRKHLSAILTLNPEHLTTLTKEAGSTAADLETAATDPNVHAYVMRRVDEINRSLARVQAIKKIAILPVELSIDGGELTPTMKVKRRVIAEKYQDIIEGLYAV